MTSPADRTSRMLSALADLTASLRDELGGKLDRATHEAAQDRAGRLRAEAAAERYLAALIQARAALEHAFVLDMLLQRHRNPEATLIFLTRRPGGDDVPKVVPMGP